MEAAASEDFIRDQNLVEGIISQKSRVSKAISVHRAEVSLLELEEEADINPSKAGAALDSLRKRTVVARPVETAPVLTTPDDPKPVVLVEKSWAMNQDFGLTTQEEVQDFEDYDQALGSFERDPNLEDLQSLDGDSLDFSIQRDIMSERTELDTGTPALSTPLSQLDMLERKLDDFTLGEDPVGQINGSTTSRDPDEQDSDGGSVHCEAEFLPWKGESFMTFNANDAATVQMMADMCLKMTAFFKHHSIPVHLVHSEHPDNQVTVVYDPPKIKGPAKIKKPEPLKRSVHPARQVPTSLPIPTNIGTQGSVDNPAPHTSGPLDQTRATDNQPIAGPSTSRPTQAPPAACEWKYLEVSLPSYTDGKPPLICKLEAAAYPRFLEWSKTKGNQFSMSMSNEEKARAIVGYLGKALRVAGSYGYANATVKRVQ